MTEDMIGKIAVIAGGSPEVAEATARLLATRGAAGLVVAGRGAERGQAIAAIISAAGCPTHFLPVDLFRAQDCTAIVTEAELVFSRIDVLIVGAGEVPYLPLEETTPEKLDQLLAAKVRAPFLILQAAAGLMQRTGVQGTLIVTIGGTGGDGPRMLAAAAGRGALAAMVRGFAESLAADQIRAIGLVLDEARTDAAAPPSEIASLIVDLAAGNVTSASGSIFELAQARTPGTVTA